MAGLEVDPSIVQEVDNYVKSNKVIIFSKSKCPFCLKVKDLFKTLGVEFCAVELDQTRNGESLQKAMAKKAGRSTVPQVFIEEQHVGGCDDTMAAHKSGQLKQLLKL